MKAELEIQRAHDILVEVITGRVPNPFGADYELPLLAAASVLCWVLEHDHNPAFGDNLARLEGWLAEKGYVVEKAGQPFTGNTHPLGPRP